MTQEAPVRMLRRAGEVRVVRVLVLFALAFGAAVVAGRIAARLFYDDVIWAFNGWFVPFDTLIFLNAGDAVLNGSSPYPTVAELTDDFNYVYPPLLAILITPLSAAPHSVASTVFTTASIVAIVAGLWLLGVRDWRCHLLALFSVPAHEALHWGTIVPLLLLLVGVCWRYRDSAAASAGAAAGAIVLKLFLWPLVLWLAMTRRVRHAFMTVVLAAGLALGSWAVIAFRGFVDYPRLLEKLSDLEADRSYSVFAIGRALGLPDLGAQALSLALGAGLFLLAVRAIRTAETPREADRRSLTLVIVGALALTPIVWFHSFMLLYVPIALARPRLSALWLAPMPLWVLFGFGWYNDWPDGNVVELLSVVAFTALVTLWSLRPPGAAIRSPLRRAQSSAA